MRRTLLSLLAVLAVAGLAGAAVLEATKIELKDFELKPKAEDRTDGVGFNEGDAKLFFYVEGTATAKIKVPEDGKYTLTLEMSGDEAEKEKPKVSIMADKEELEKSFELKQTEAKEYTFEVTLKKGEVKLAIAFLNDAYKEGEFDRNLYIHAVKFEAKKK